MNTNTNTTGDAPEPTFYVSDEHKGFTFDPDPVLGAATADMLRLEGATFDQLLEGARKLATADAASKLTPPQRAEQAAATIVDWPGRPGIVNTMTGSTYSKRCKVGRASDEQVLEFLLACADPTLNKLYEWLPKDAAMSKPRAKTAARVSSPKVEPEPETAPEPVAPFRWDAKHVSTSAEAVLNMLRAQGADDESVRLVMADVMRRVRPVSSVKAVA